MDFPSFYRVPKSYRVSDSFPFDYARVNSCVRYDSSVLRMVFIKMCAHVILMARFLRSLRSVEMTSVGQASTQQSIRLHLRFRSGHAPVSIIGHNFDISLVWI